VTRISFRGYRLAEHETVTDEALAGMRGQTFVIRDGDRQTAARVVEAVVRDGWIVATADLDVDDFPSTFAAVFDVGPLSVRVLPDMPAEQRYVPTPGEPDWSSIPQTLAPSRLDQVLYGTDSELRFHD
jgi:hypothetical protein